MGSFARLVESCQLCPTARVQTVCIRTVHLAPQGLNQLEFTYGDLEYVAQLTKLSILWSEP